MDALDGTRTYICLYPNRVQAFMKENGMTEIWLAEQTGLTRAKISSLMQGKKTTVKTARKVMLALGVDEDQEYHYWGIGFGDGE